MLTRISVFAMILALLPATSAAANARSDRWAEVSVGKVHTCALTEAGHAYCWGMNYTGQLGIGSADRQPHTTPLPVRTEHRFTAIAASEDHTCAIDTDGTTHCWGQNDFGQLGGESTEECMPARGNAAVPCSTAPVTASVPALAAITVRGTQSCGLDTRGQAYCWGEIFGATPTPIAPDRTFSWIGLRHDREVCGLTPDGQVLCAFHRRGEVPFNPEFNEYRFTTFSIDNFLNCGLTADGTTLCVKEAFGKQNADGSYIRELVPVSGDLRFRMLQVGSFFSLHLACGITTNGKGYCWKRPESESTGSESAPASEIFGPPTPIPGELTFRTLSLGLLHACAITTDGALYCWGSTTFGNTGPGADLYQNEPVRLPAPGRAHD